MRRAGRRRQCSGRERARRHVRVGDRERARYCARDSGRGARDAPSMHNGHMAWSALKHIEGLCSEAPAQVRWDASRPVAPKHRLEAHRDVLRRNAGLGHAEIPWTALARACHRQDGGTRAIAETLAAGAPSSPAGHERPHARYAVGKYVRRCARDAVRGRTRCRAQGAIRER